MSFVEVLICMSFGLERGLSWRIPFLRIGGLDAQFSVSGVPFGPGTDIRRS